MAKALVKFGGVPTGGSNDHVLTKTSGSDHAVAWEAAGGGGSPAVISESGDFTLDPTVHTDGCRIILTAAGGTSYRNITLPVLASQPAAGYSVFVAMASGGGALVVMSGGGGSVDSGVFAYVAGAIITYVGSDVWSICIMGSGIAPNTSHVTNTDP